MKYFAISDIHGFYNEMRAALRKAGYQKSNPDHVLIVCGDIFDRGPDAVKVYKFLKSIPRARRILIRGNHEYLLREAIERGYFESHDRHNRTDDTVRQFLQYYYPAINADSFGAAECFKNLGILRWIFSDEWVNYWELDDYIFVHSWIPVVNNSYLPIYALGDYSDCEFCEDWREAHAWDWEEATWGCPWLFKAQNLAPPGKTMVCGHWHASHFRVGLDHAPDDCDDNALYIGDGIIGLDACTAYSGFCNVFVIEK